VLIIVVTAQLAASGVLLHMPEWRYRQTGSALAESLAHGRRNANVHCGPIQPPKRQERRGRQSNLLGALCDLGGFLLVGAPNKNPRPMPLLRQSEGASDSAECSDYAWNELPHPQDLTAFGLSNLNPRASRPS
jgi:hypothetical protein